MCLFLGCIFGCITDGMLISKSLFAFELNLKFAQIVESSSYATLFNYTKAWFFLKYLLLLWLSLYLKSLILVSILVTLCFENTLKYAIGLFILLCFQICFINLSYNISVFSILSLKFCSLFLPCLLFSVFTCCLSLLLCNWLFYIYISLFSLGTGKETEESNLLQQLSDACLVVDALEPSVREDLVKNFCNRELTSYQQIFEGAGQSKFISYYCDQLSNKC